MEKKRARMPLLSTAAIVLIPAAVGINYVGKLFAELLKLPLWLDSIGTILASLLAGPVVGMIAGIINNIIYGLTVGPISFVYAITSGAIGLMAGIMAYRGWISGAGKALAAGLLIGIAAAAISTPINMIFWEGQTGNAAGDFVFGYMLNQGLPLWAASFCDSIVVDLPDKVVTVFISYLIVRGLPGSLTSIYSRQRYEEL